MIDYYSFLKHRILTFIQYAIFVQCWVKSYVILQSFIIYRKTLWVFSMISCWSQDISERSEMLSQYNLISGDREYNIISFKSSKSKCCTLFQSLTQEYLTYCKHVCQMIEFILCRKHKVISHRVMWTHYAKFGS